MVATVFVQRYGNNAQRQGIDPIRSLQLMFGRQKLMISSYDITSYRLDSQGPRGYIFDGRITSITGGCITGGATNYVVYAC
jgi:hypothetical protein